MVDDMNKRNSESGTASLPGDEGGARVGVGGRQDNPLPSTGGGGYLDTCSILNFRPRNGQKNRDPRLDELHQMGLQRVWLEIAETIGVDGFLATWRLLDAAFQSSMEDHGRMLVPIRAYRTFLKFQRNRYIHTLVSMGMSTREIREKVRLCLCEEVTVRHINRIRRIG